MLLTRFLFLFAVLGLALAPNLSFAAADDDICMRLLVTTGRIRTAVQQAAKAFGESESSLEKQLFAELERSGIRIENLLDAKLVESKGVRPGQDYVVHRYKVTQVGGNKTTLVVGVPTPAPSPKPVEASSTEWMAGMLLELKQRGLIPAYIVDTDLQVSATDPGTAHAVQMEAQIQLLTGELETVQFAPVKDLNLSDLRYSAFETRPVFPTQNPIERAAEQLSALSGISTTKAQSALAEKISTLGFKDWQILSVNVMSLLVPEDEDSVTPWEADLVLTSLNGLSKQVALQIPNDVAYSPKNPSVSIDTFAIDRVLLRASGYNAIKFFDLLHVFSQSKALKRTSGEITGLRYYVSSAPIASLTFLVKFKDGSEVAVKYPAVSYQ
jgi:hypothetical protein